MTRPVRLWLCIMIILLLVLPLAWAQTNEGGSEQAGGQPEEAEATPKPAISYARALLSLLNMSEYMQHVRYLSSLGSRIPGYPGYYAAVDYVEKVWRSYGLQVIREPFNITVPVAGESYIEVELPNGTRLRMRAYPLWPNLVNPSPYESPPEGDLLIWGGSGYLEEVDGREVAGRFVLMDFNCRWYWKNLAMLGAKGVIFIEPQDTSRIECDLKLINIPLYFPKLYISRKDGLLLRKLLAEHGTLRVWVHSRMEWRNVVAYNLIAVFNGSDPKLAGQVIVFEAPLDTWSVVPEIAPGATDALGLALLLELPKLLLNKSSLRTVWLVALSGHHFLAWGAREFVARHWNELGSKIVLFVSFDLAYDSDWLAFYHTGGLYLYRFPQMFRQNYRWILPVMTNVSVSLIRAFGEEPHILDMVFMSRPGWVADAPPYLGIVAIFDSEPVAEALYGAGLALATVNSIRQYQRTPLDTADRVVWANVERQLRVCWLLVNYLTHVENLGKTFERRARLADDWGYVTLTIQAGVYNFTKRWYDPFAHKGLIFVVQCAEQLGMAYAWPYPLVILANASGCAVIHGLKPYSTVDVQAYVIDDHGRVIYARDTGVYGRLGLVELKAPEVYWIVAMFRCASVAVLNVLDPRTFGFPTSVDVLNKISHTWIIWRDVLIAWPDIMAFVQPDVPVEVILRSVAQAMQMPTLVGWMQAWMGPALQVLQAPALAVFFNSTPELGRGGLPKSYGYMLRAGDMLVLSPIDAARDMCNLVRCRMEVLHRGMTFSPYVEDLYGRMLKHEELFKKALEERRWGEAYAHAYEAWAFAAGAYIASFALLIEVILSAVFFSLVLVPFTIALERLVFSYQGFRRFVTTAALFTIFYLILASYHPGFRLATNIFILLSAYLIALTIIAVLVFSVSEAYSATKELRRKVMGMHTIEIERSSAIAMAFSVGIQNMRRRRLRTILTILSIAITTTALVAFTSVQATMAFRVTQKQGPAYYTGLLLRKPTEMYLQADITQAYIPEHFYLELRALFGREGEVSPRCWVYPIGRIAWLDWRRRMGIRAILGVAPSDRAIFEPAIVKGTFFEPGDLYVCLVSRSLASKAGLSFGSKINLWGVNLTVIGILDDQVLSKSLVDFDGFPPLPIDRMQAMLARQVVPVPTDQLIIVPYALVREVFANSPYFVSEISIKLPNADLKQLEALAEDFGTRLLMDVYYGQLLSAEENIGILCTMRARRWFAVRGAQYAAIPLLLAAFTVLTTMLGAVYERLREINIYSAIGLAPSHIGGIFLSESLIYALVGTVFGYLVGVLASILLWKAGAYPPGLYPNVSSLVIVEVVGVLMAATIISCLYPSMKASKAATPSLERRWRIPTRPMGREWVVPMPFKATKDEVLGIFAFLKEYLETHSVERGGLFLVSAPFRYSEERLSDGRLVRKLSTVVRLAPFDMGIIQDLEIIAIGRPGQLFSFEIRVYRRGGYEDVWINSNTVFFDRLRKQFLLWRGFTPKEKSKYIRMWKQMLPELQKEGAASRGEA